MTKSDHYRKAFLMSESNPVQLLFSSLGRLQVLGEFCGRDLSSDGGIMLLREVDLITRLTERVASCFTDHRIPNHRVQTPLLLGQPPVGSGSKTDQV